MLTEPSSITNKGKAFIGVSLDSKLFSRTWVRFAIDFILERHHCLLFLLADDLLRYTRTAQVISNKTVLKIAETSNLINNRRLEFEKFLISEVNRIDKHSQTRILIKSWRSFTDNSYVNILRNLQIAYATLIPFQQCVNDVALKHIEKNLTKLHFQSSLKASTAFLLDEVAMCLRITEIDQFQYEYYPTNQIDIITELYADKFVQYGLSIEALTGKTERSRKFNILDLQYALDSNKAVSSQFIEKAKIAQHHPVFVA